MVRIELDHVVHCASPQFWTGFLNADTATRFYTSALGFTRFDVLHQARSDAATLRDVDCHLPLSLGRPLRVVFGSGFRFVEHGRFSQPERTWHFAWTPAVLASRVRFDGWMRAIDSDDTPATCRRIVRIEVAARVPAIGGLIERTAEQFLRESWDRSAVELNKWIVQGWWA